MVSFVKAGGYNRRHLSFYQYLHGEAKINVVILKVFHFLEIKKKKTEIMKNSGLAFAKVYPPTIYPEFLFMQPQITEYEMYIIFHAGFQLWRLDDEGITSNVLLNKRTEAAYC